MIRRAAWRAVGLTGLPAAQRKRGRLHGRTAPFEAARRPRPGKWSPPAASLGAQVGGRSTRRGACGARPPAAGPRDGRRRLGARRRGRCTRGPGRAARALARGRLPRARAAGAQFSPAAAGDAFAARPARAGAPEAPSEATRAPRGAPGPRRPRRPRPRPRARGPDSARSSANSSCPRSNQPHGRTNDSEGGYPPVAGS